MEGAGCIAAQCRQFTALGMEELMLLQTLESDPRRYPAGATVCKAGGHQGARFYTVHSGWAYATRILADGQRQVLDIFLPGQIMGLRDIGFSCPQSDLIALTDLVVCPFPRQRLNDVFCGSRRMTELLFLILAREQAMLTERIINIGRRPAAQRLAHFILEMKVRLQQRGNRFSLPLNQTIIGDALGLSAVHVSRTLKELRRLDLVTFTDGQVHISNLDALITLAEFSRRYLEGQSDELTESMVGASGRSAADRASIH